MLRLAKLAAAATLLILILVAGCAGDQTTATPMEPVPTSTPKPPDPAPNTRVFWEIFDLIHTNTLAPRTLEPSPTARPAPTPIQDPAPTAHRTPEPPTSNTSPAHAPQNPQAALAELNRLLGLAGAQRADDEARIRLLIRETGQAMLLAAEGNGGPGISVTTVPTPPAAAPAQPTPASAAAQFPPEAGGRTNPNDAAFPLMYFQGHGVNPFIDADEDPKSTFSLDGDQASYRIWLNYAVQGAVIPPEAVRTEEFVNAMPQGYRKAAAEPRIILDAMPSPFGPDGYILLRAGYAAPRAPSERNPVSIVFVLDASGSMAGDNRINTATSIIGKITGMMLPGDEAALAVFSDQAEVRQGFTPDPKRIRQAADEIIPGGSTYTADGIAAAYRLATSRIAAGQDVRIVLLSDGVANVGPSGPQSILEVIEAAARSETIFTSIGVGITGNYNDALLEALANRGNGTYHYITTPEDAERYAREGIENIFFQPPREARIQVSFNPRAVRKYRLLGYENRAVADSEFREDSLDFGEPSYHRDAAALYEIRLNDDASPGMILATARLRYRPAAHEAHREAPASITVGETANNPEDAAPHLRLAAAAAQIAELLRRSYYAQCETWDHPMRILKDAAERLPEATGLDEFRRAAAAYAGIFQPVCDRRAEADEDRGEN